jgi:tetratricopeptide (TPR) repeat protein
VGLLWALVASAPLIAVASVWSAYYYLYALCGVALALGALVARGPRWAALALVAALAAGSQVGRANPEFATARGAWNWQSHTNRRYIDRATERIARYLSDMKRLHPTVPHRSTFFFAGVPAFLAWQAADGPLVRWAYRDTSLRSYYQANFTLERGRRGPVFFFYVAGDSLHEETTDPISLRGIALRNMLSDRMEASRDMLVWLAQREPAPDVLYFLTWLEWALGDTLAARGWLARTGIQPASGPLDADYASRLLAAGDTAAAVNMLATAATRHAFDPRGHAMLSDLLVQINPNDAHARIEALAARALTPQDPDAWLRWGLIQANDGRHTQAIRSLEQSLALGLRDSTRTRQVRAILRDLARMVPGGELAQAEMRRAVRAPPVAP